MLDRNWILEMLQNSVCTLYFIKLDGSRTSLKCTLMDAYLPEQYRTGQLLSEYGGDNISVWNLETNSWKSFNINTVSSVKISNLDDERKFLN